MGDLSVARIKHLLVTMGNRLVTGINQSTGYYGVLGYKLVYKLV